MKLKDFLKIAKPVMLYDDDQDLIYISEDGKLIRNMDTRHWLKPYPDKKKRPKVKLHTKNGKNGWKEFYVCRLVADAFIPNPRDKPFVHHVNGDPSDNHFSNLVWVTRQEHGLCHKLMRNDKKEYEKLIEKLRTA